MGSLAGNSSDGRVVFFFDIDNCLYPRSKNVHDMMQVLIDKYFEEHLSLTEADARILHLRYYKDYGLALEGLIRHHKIDPLEYNDRVDNALPLDSVLSQDLALRSLLQDFDTRKVKLWLFTNAYQPHAERVVRLLGVADLFEGITFCDYAQKKLVCKPHQEAYAKAERDAGLDEGRVEKCFFVDDSYLNCSAAQTRGWATVHKLEDGDPEPEKPAGKFQIRSLQELRTLFPQFFKIELEKH